MKRFFVHTEDGTECYFTEEEARTAANEAISEIREGEIREEAKQIRVGWWIKRYEADACKHGSQCRSGTPPMLTTIDRTVCVCGDWKVVEY